MVRTQPRVVPLQIDVSRVLGWSTALALHVLALMLLLIPAAYVAAPLPRERMQIRMLVPPEPTPPVPVPIKPDVPTLVQPRTVPKPQVAPLPPPTANADDALAVAPLRPVNPRPGPGPQRAGAGCRWCRGAAAVPQRAAAGLPDRRHPQP